jgi:hypothetical protein
MEIARGLPVLVNADSVMSPMVHYGIPMTAIYFDTDDDQFGRITFENFDSLKISRGEYLPFSDDWEEGKEFHWVSKVEHSTWQKERYEYEKKHYGKAYEFRGNVGEMKSDFSHYIFSFHDQYIEVIVRGFWIEKDSASLMGKPLQEGHPFLPLPETNMEKFTAHNLTCQIRKNEKPIDELVSNARFCSQKLFEFALELEGKASVDNTLFIAYRSGKLISSLRGYFGRQELEFEGTATLEDVKPAIEKYMEKVYERRRAMGK